MPVRLSPRFRIGPRQRKVWLALWPLFGAFLLSTVLATLGLPDGSGVARGADAFPLADAGLSSQNSETLRTAIWGDVYCDDVVDAEDALHILAVWVAGFLTFPECGPNIFGLVVGEPLILDGKSAKWGDVNCDGVVASSDALLILRSAAGLQRLV